MAKDKPQAATDDTAPVEASGLTAYFFPTHGIMIEAASREEAEQQLEAHIKSSH